MSLETKGSFCPQSPVLLIVSRGGDHGRLHRGGDMSSGEELSPADSMTSDLAKIV